MKKYYIFLTLFFTFLLPFTNGLNAQAIPLEIINDTYLADDSIFVAIVGKNYNSPVQDIWINLLTGQQNLMETTDNTIDGPTPSPGPNGQYADCFYRLSDIQNRTVSLDLIQGCRVFISMKEQLYLYFYGPTGGYAAPNPNNPTDANIGITYEFLEFTYDTNGLFGNTSRVDAYKRPLGLELFAESGAYHKHVGERTSHQDIIASFPQSVPVEFQACLNLQDSTITQPSKIPEWGTNGPYENYFQSYIDSIWNKYTNEDLIFDAGTIGIYKGRVDNLDSLVLECIAGSTDFLGRKGRIVRRPNTQEAIEGSGVLKQIVQDTTVDFNVQKHICAAINRHVIDVSSTVQDTQNWSNPAAYYQSTICNHYAKFWHLQGISFDQLSYGFAYDDVWEQSSSLNSINPDSLKVYIGYNLLSNTSTTSTTNLKPLKPLVAFPNGTKNSSTVSGIEGGSSLRVFDLQGKILQEIRLNSMQDKIDVDLSNYSNGIYMIQVHSEKWMGIVKIIKL